MSMIPDDIIQQELDKFRDSFLTKSVDELKKLPEYGHYDIDIKDLHFSVGFWNNFFGQSELVFKISGNKGRFFASCNFISDVHYGNNLVRKMTDKECSYHD